MGEIAKRVEVPRSTVQRIVSALADEQFLISATPRSRVKLGPAILRLAGATRMDISQLLRPHLEALSERLGETVDLSVLQAQHAVFIAQIKGNHRLQAVSALGERFPLYCTACGKALLATLPPEELDRHIEPKPEPLTPNTITSRELLMAQVERARETLVCTDFEEHTEGICAVGTFFSDAIGNAYAVSVPVPATRFRKKGEDYYSAELLRTRKELLAVSRQARGR